MLRSETKVELPQDPISFDMAECIKLFWNYLRSQGNAESNLLQQIKNMLGPHERRLSKQTNNSVPSVCDIALSAVVDAFAAVVCTMKGLILFKSDCDVCSRNDRYGNTEYPNLTKLRNRLSQKDSYKTVYNKLRSTMSHDLFMGRIAWLERRVSGSKLLPCFTAVVESSLAQPSAQWPISLSTSCPNIPVVVLACTPGGSGIGEICCPFSMTLEMAMQESKIRHSIVYYTGPLSPSFQTPALRLDGTRWIFGLNNIWKVLKQRYRIHTSSILPRLAHAPAFNFFPTLKYHK